MSDRVSGKIKFYDAKKGYGFAVRDDGCGDVFVHARALPFGVDELDAGDRISFEVEPGQKGKEPRAVCIALEPVRRAA